MNLTYVSAAMDASGYAEAARNHIAALHLVGVGVRVESLSFEQYKSNLGDLGSLVQSLVKKGPEGPIRVLHQTPQNFSQLMKRDKYNIGYVAWETDRLPDAWVPEINKLQEVWVPCDHNVEVFKNSGVTIPVFSMPHPFTKRKLEGKSLLANKKEDEFLFYSIFQWTARKNPEGLLRAYLTEFTPEEKVALILKTYLINPNNQEESKKVKEYIREIKAKLYMKKYPKILLISSLLSREQITSLHEESNCYISLHRAEGFGIPIAEAMLAGNPVITTCYGGPEMFIKHGETGYSVPYIMTPCYGMPWDVYPGTMNWAEPDILKARKTMREVYQNKEAAKIVGIQGKKYLEENYSWEKLGNRMKDRLLEIERKL